MIKNLKREVLPFDEATLKGVSKSLDEGLIEGYAWDEKKIYIFKAK